MHISTHKVRKVPKRAISTKITSEEDENYAIKKHIRQRVSSDKNANLENIYGFNRTEAQVEMYTYGWTTVNHLV